MGMTLVDSAVAASDSTIDFTGVFTSDYDLYEIHLVNMHPQTNGQQLSFQVNAVGGSGFNETITAGAHRAYHREINTETRLEYYLNVEQAQGTAYQKLTSGIGTGSDEAASGILRIWNPSNTTYAKHFGSRVNGYNDSDYSVDVSVGGYINTTSAIDDISFKMTSGNIDEGEILIYGIS